MKAQIHGEIRLITSSATAKNANKLSTASGC